MVRWIVALSCFLTLGAPTLIAQTVGKQKPQDLTQQLLRARTWQEHHLLIGEQAEVANGLTELIDAYEVALLKKKDDALLLGGFAEAVRNAFWLRLNMVAKPGEISGEIPLNRAQDALHLATSKHPKVAYGWVQLYYHVNQHGERGLPKPRPVKVEWTTLTSSDGEVLRIPVETYGKDVAKEARLAAIFSKMLAVAPEDPGVLLIRAMRAESDVERFGLFKRAFDAGGNKLFPSVCRYQMIVSARRMGKAEVAGKLEQELRDHLRTRSGSIWTRAFRRKHPDFK